uniref:Uncharacterized protein n=1 Tax=Glossina austeni TaxID=7395 RepID=A0A1A9VK04_GLOAU
MVILMVGIGGFTRLSKAGLSITEWKPITGTLPPLSGQDWLQEKLKYETTPEPKQTKLKISSDTIYYTGMILALIVIQIIFGAFVAGLNAGLIYNTFPLMDGQIVPEDLFFLHPIWLNIFENRATVQFIHRALALLILALVVILTVKNASVKPDK